MLTVTFHSPDIADAVMGCLLDTPYQPGPTYLVPFPTITELEWFLEDLSLSLDCLTTHLTPAGE